MKAQELRIGDITAQGTIKSITIYYVKTENGLYDLFSIEPIPLTEEWLLKFGLRKLSNIWQLWENSVWSFEQHKYQNAYWLTYCSEQVDCTKIKYVHQLQNLYFALTGEELAIKDVK